MSPDLLALGKRVRQARRRMNMTQQQLAERVSCSPEWISKIERGRASPSLSCITTIGSVLGADLTILLKSEEGKMQSAPEQAASMIRALSSNNQQLALCLVEALLRRQRELEGLPPSAHV